MKKILSMIMAVVVLVATQLPIKPVYAASYTPMYETAKKVAGTTPLSGVYNYQLNINNNKLIATGKYGRMEDPTKLSIQLQITKPVTYTSLYVGTDGIARVEGISNGIKVGSRWELLTTIPIVRSTNIAGNKKISMEVDLVGLADGIYNLQEVVIKNGKKEGHFGDSVLLVVHKGIPSLQTTWIYAHLTHWWHDAGFWIS